MLVSREAAMPCSVRYLTTQAKDDEVRYVHGEVGYNFRLTNIQAAMGRARAAAREPADTRRDAITSTTKTARTLRHAGADSTAKQPAAVATPLPPFLKPE